MVDIRFQIIFVTLLTVTQVFSATAPTSQIYRISNRQEPNLYVTGVNLKKDDSPVVADGWRGAATQKWRLTKIDTTLFEFKPTSDETREMGIDSTNTNLVSQQVIRWYHRIGISNSPHQWTLVPVDGGYYQIKNYKNAKCLHNYGDGKQVGLASCVNALRQQWHLENI